MKIRNLVAIIAGWVLAADASDAQTAPTARQPVSTAQKDEPIMLSPFEVAVGDKGYVATNTMSGTRMNSKLADLGAAISVVTKQQIEDLGLLDINDIFNYEVNTEGTGNYTEFTFDRSGMPLDTVSSDPQNANRIRGLTAANNALGNFETSGRTPIDPTNLDAVEISRGPNSSIFGVGSPSGTVNSVPASANLQRNATTVVARADTNDGWRTSIDFNRVLKRDVLAVRASVVKQYDGFALKPSGVATLRLNGMAKYHPFKKTTLSGSYSYYRAHGNRPNAMPPRDGISGWRRVGAPTWDPITSTAKINGNPVGTFAAANPAYFNALWGTILGYVDQAGLSYLGQARGSPGTTPFTQNQTQRLVTPKEDPSGYLATQPLFQQYPVLVDQTIYDWSSINLSAANRFDDKTSTLLALLDQSLIQTHRQKLDLQLGYFRENTDRFTRILLGSKSPRGGFASTVTIDVNERMLDGSLNPYFLRPFIQLERPFDYDLPLDRDTYRAQLAYRLDLRNETNRLRWLGLHVMSGFGEYKNVVERTYAFRDAIVSNHAWTDTRTVRGGSTTNPIYQRFYVGDNKGNNVDYAPTAYSPGTYSLRWGNAATRQFVSEPLQIGSAGFNVSGSGNTATANSWTILKSQGAMLQSFFLKDRLVTTFGVRSDQRYGRPGQTPVWLDGTTRDEASFLGWMDGDWLVGKGRTTSAGAVLKPLPWFSLHANKSNSFVPSEVGYDLYRNILPDPTGEGHDYGFRLTLIDNKLGVRVNRYKTVQNNARNGVSATVAQRVRRIDFSSAGGGDRNLQRQATAWLTEAAQAQGVTLTEAQLNQRLADVTKLPVNFVVDAAPEGTARDDLTARGIEIEVDYNPNNFWTMKLNVAQQESINSALAGDVSRWISERLAVWPKIIDPRFNVPWWTRDYGTGSAASYFASDVLTPLQIAKAFEGKSRPQVREYRANFLTSLRLAGITDHRLLKRFTVGGAARWEDRGAIGFRGVQQPPAVVTELDAKQPIWDKSHTYLDAFVAYRTKLFSDKVGLTLQLNARNVTESGGLQPIAVEPDGRVSAYRIIDPRLFILTATFSL